LPGKCRNGVVVAFVTSAFFLGEWRTANLLHVLYIGRFRKVSREKKFSGHHLEWSKDGIRVALCFYLNLILDQSVDFFIPTTDVVCPFSRPKSKKEKKRVPYLRTKWS